MPEHFISFFAAILMLYEPLKNLGRLNNVIQAGRAGAERALAVLDWEDEVQQDRGTLEVSTLREGIRERR